MIVLIPLIQDDCILVSVYVLIITASFFLQYNKWEYLIFTIGFFAMLISEYFFISTGVEIFLRHSLFGIMPVWLPVLWAYGFVVISRSLHILQTK